MWARNNGGMMISKENPKNFEQEPAPVATCPLSIYRGSKKPFPDYKHLLQENYVEYKHFFFQNVTQPKKFLYNQLK
jgi:hypothetical protein